ncbi:C39 family peptidase [Ihubacter sp. mB4P-1]|uniref:C39 family peptidase n=1 Tax=Ihubacter sp. mB4P-1 TaxID=3242370 RepID=UPI00137B90E3
MRRLFLKSIFLRIMLIAVLIWNCGAIFADTSDEYRQKQLEQSPNYYSDENQKEVAKLKQRVDEYLLIKKRLEQSPGYYTEKNQKEVAELRQRVEEYLKNNVSVNATRRMLEVTMYQQEKTYYCGPATAQMVIYYGGFHLYSQDTLANYMQTNRADGTYVYQIRKGINNYWSKGNYREVTTSEMKFSSSLVYSIDKGRPVPCHVMTGRLPSYDGYSVGHYVLARGYDSSESRVYYIDPHYDSAHYGKHYCTYTKMSNAINDNAGYYIAAE